MGVCVQSVLLAWIGLHQLCAQPDAQLRILEAKAGLSGIGVAGCQRLCTSAVGSRTSDVQTFLDVAGVAGRQASAHQVVLKLRVY